MPTTDTIVCPNCQRENVSSAKHCSFCGVPLPDKSNSNDHSKLGSENTADHLAPSIIHLPSKPSAIPTSTSSPTTTPTSPLPSVAPASSSQTAQIEDSTPSSTTSPTKEGIRQKLQKLENLTPKIAEFFPADLPGKDAKLDEWKAQIRRARWCLKLFDHDLLQETLLQDSLYQEPLLALSNAVKALDFTHEYTVKLLGSTGTGKSTLLNAILDRDILPTGQGAAVTGVPIRVVLCNPQETEELRIHFLTREAFENILEATKKEAEDTEGMASSAVKATTMTQQRKQDTPFTQEYNRLMYLKNNKDPKGEKSYTDTYLQAGNPNIIKFPVGLWERSGKDLAKEPAGKYSRDFIMEPAGNTDPYLPRMVDYAEFRIHVEDGSVLPEGSVWVDLPGGSAGQVRHEQILGEALQELDAIILTTGGERYNDKRTTEIFNQVSTILDKKYPSVAAQMVFIAATSWDKNGADQDRELAKAAMRDLLGNLGKFSPHFLSRYESTHGHQFPIDDDHQRLSYYPVVAFGARMAVLGLKKEKLNARQQQEVDNYAGIIKTLYKRLERVDKSLPENFTAQEFKDFPHQAMRDLSGLPELVKDLQIFLTQQRYDVQLQQATSQLSLALRSIEEICWNHVNQHGFPGHNLQSLKQQNRKRAESIQSNRTKWLTQAYQGMSFAWQQALDNYELARNQPPNRSEFYQALTNAYKQVVDFLKQRIDSRDFDSFIEIPTYTGGGRLKPSWAIVPGEDAVEVRGNALRSELRSRLAGVLDQLMQEQPAEELADMFLATIRKQGEGTGGALDIKGMTFGESNTMLDEIEQSFDELLLDLRDVAGQVCRFVAVSDLFDEKHMLPKKHQLMHDFYALEDSLVATESGQQQGTNSTPESILGQGRELMKQMVDVLSSHLVSHVYHRVAFMYRNELEKQRIETTYDIAAISPQAFSTEPGHFNQITTRWFHTMLELLRTSPTLGQAIDSRLTLAESTIDFDAWAELIESIRTQRGAA
jgi:Dynamin family